MDDDARADHWAAIVARARETTVDYKAGELIAASIDAPWMNDSNAACVLKWLRQGLILERVPLQWAKANIYTTNVYQPEARGD